MSGSILVMDSGSGGLSVWQEIRLRLPDFDTLYLADFSGLPYGTKTDAEIEERVFSLLDVFLPQFEPVLIVVACNTVSTLLLDRLRQRYHLPFVGVVPAIKTAAEISAGGRIALLATQATVCRAYTQKLIDDFAAHCDVLRLPQDHLVQAGEDWVRGKDVSLAIQQTLSSLAVLDVDTVVLGCTHFPLLKGHLMSEGSSWSWVDSGAAIARRVGVVVQDQNLAVNQRGAHQAYYTGRTDALWEAGVLRLGMTRAAPLGEPQPVIR